MRRQGQVLCQMQSQMQSQVQRKERQVLGQMCTKVRTEAKLTRAMWQPRPGRGTPALDQATAKRGRASCARTPAPRGTPAADAKRMRGGARALVNTYRRLAETRSHVLEPVLHGATPTQWEHYPSDDAISKDRRYQWYYHSHSPEDRPGSIEHGHFHLFARMEGVAELINPEAERRFLCTLGVEESAASTRHLLCIGVNPVGLPISLFAVNRWVTGDSLLSGTVTQLLLRELRLDTGYPTIDGWMMALIRLYAPEIRSLIVQRDRNLRQRAALGPGTFDDPTLEVLSDCALDVDQRIAAVSLPATRRARQPAIS